MQTTNRLLMIRPNGFSINLQTAGDNIYQDKSFNVQKPNIMALAEFDAFVKMLQDNKIQVDIFEGTNETPDDVFPNNWISTSNNNLCIYPMKAENRRLEVRQDIINHYKPRYKNFLDYTNFCDENIFLEGTGSLVLDHINRKAYMSISQRSNLVLAKTWAKDNNYEIISLEAHTLDGSPIYHTNVFLSVCKDVAIVCFDVIKPSYHKLLRESLESTNHKIIEMSYDEHLHFACNCLEVRNTDNKNILILSKTSYDFFSPQKQELIASFFHGIITPSIPTIERLGGGSVRCMCCEIF